FRELEAFAQLGTDLDAATQRQLDRGRRLVELLKQPQYRPYDVADQILSIFAGTQGYLDDLPLDQVADFEEQLLTAFRDEHPEIAEEIVRTGVLSDELDKKIREVISNFKPRFAKKRAEAAV
ncbi:MAG: F0F1 ATP synthase subunit alpha, partial [Planctomycetota bacterium]